MSLATGAQASLLVYEGFDYALSNNASMNGVIATGTGLTGNWASTNGANTTTNYVTGGLSFGSSYATTAGALQLHAQSNQTAIVGVGLSAATVTGNLWSSYLVNFSVLSSGEATTVSRLNTSSATTGGTTKFQSQADTQAGDRKPGTAYAGTVVTTGSDFTLASDTTYLVLSQFTNVGVAVNSGNPGVSKQWVFTLTGYENWLADGADAEKLGLFASAFTTQSHTVTGTSSYSGYAQFANWAQNGTGSPVQTVLFDELRYGTTLGDVLSTIPEPSAFAAFAGIGALGFAALRRRQAA